MKMNLAKWVGLGALSVALCSCASTDAGVSITSQSSTTYAPVPVNAVHVSSHPPKGKYIVIASLTANVQPNETPSHVLQRMQDSAASIGADYVLVTSVADKTYLTPQNLSPTDSPYTATQRDFFSTADSPGDNYVPNYTREIITGQALKITSGSNKPNKAAPSMLWQINSGQ